MTFYHGNHGGRRDRTDEGRRYATWEEAQEGHSQIVREVEAKLPEEPNTTSR